MLHPILTNFIQKAAGQNGYNKSGDESRTASKINAELMDFKDQQTSNGTAVRCCRKPADGIEVLRGEWILSYT
jgi:hypothetical protein